MLLLRAYYRKGTMSHALNNDRQIQMADALLARMKNASLGDFVEWLTALAFCFRTAVVNGESPDPSLTKIVQEMIAGIDKNLSDRYEGDDAEERRACQARVSKYLGAMKPVDIADLMDEMAEGYRDVLLHDDGARLRRFFRSFSADIALVSSPTVNDLVRLDRSGVLKFEIVKDDAELMADCASSAAS
jgi:hypothetical protein